MPAAGALFAASWMLPAPVLLPPTLLALLLLPRAPLSLLVSVKHLFIKQLPTSRGQQAMPQQRCPLLSHPLQAGGTTLQTTG